MGVGVKIRCLRALPAPNFSWWSQDRFEQEDSFDVTEGSKGKKVILGRGTHRNKGPEERKCRAGVENGKERI